MSSATLPIAAGTGAYAEREHPSLSWLDRQGERISSFIRRTTRSQMKGSEQLISQVSKHGESLASLDERELDSQLNEISSLLNRSGLTEDGVARSFALIREVADRTIRQRHYDVQLLGGWVLLHGMLAEMETGEGKTLTATLAAATMALCRIPVHVVTVNDYLASRDAEAMTPVYNRLGLSVGLIQQGMDPNDRRAAYACDITYCTNKELAFDYLKDRITLGRVRTRTRLQIERLSRGASRGERLLLRGLHYAIVDEADSVLVDEARTPLIISEQREANEEEDLYRTALELADQLSADIHYRIDRRERSLELTEDGRNHLADITQHLEGLWAGPRRSGELIKQALTARHLFLRDEHYLVDDDKVQIIDEFTGRLMPDRSWERGLHQLIEIKEGCPVTGRNETLARISYQRFFRRYLRLAGMTGTAQEIRSELQNVYGLAVVRIDTHRPLARQAHPPSIYLGLTEKWDAVAARVEALHRIGRPVLIGTRTVGASEDVSERLTQRGLTHQVLNARQDLEEAEIIAAAGEYGRIVVATNMAGRGTDIRLSEEARRVGGLHVIATEYHEAGRIDRQLFGRCARQGEPGSYEVIASLEDDLIRSHGGRLATHPSIQRSVLHQGRSALMRRAQKRAERLHSRIRRSLLDSDDQLARVLAFAGRPE